MRLANAGFTCLLLERGPDPDALPSLQRMRVISSKMHTIVLLYYLRQCCIQLLYYTILLYILNYILLYIL